ncbi:MAG TPA: hypothetical protein VGH28_06325 [Polyangiaceae bacterium]|jgi:hypothetical protein
MNTWSITTIQNERVWNPATTRVATAGPSLMPEPQTPPSVGGDAMSMLYELLSKQRNNDMESGKAGIDHNRELQKAQQLKEQADFKKQEDAKASAAAWGIFGKIASAIAIAVSAVAAVCSCGAASALCVGACVLSAAAFADGETQCLSKLTGDPDASKWFDMGCGIGAALCTGGAGIAASGISVGAKVLEVAGSACKIAQQVISNSTNDQGWQYAAMGLGAAGAIGDVSMCFGGAAKAASTIFGTATKTVKAVAGATDAVMAAGEGVATIGSSQFEADAIDDGADAKQASMQLAHLQQLVDWAVDGIKDTDKSHERALQTLSGAMQTQAQTLVIASAKV